MAKEESKFVKYLDNKVEIKGKPPVGQSVAVFVRPGDKIDLEALGINLETAKFKLVGGDIILEMPNAGSYTFVSLGLMAYSDIETEFLGMGGKITSLSTILSNVEEINAVPINSIATNEFINMPNSEVELKKEKEKTETTPPQVIVTENNILPEDKNNIEQSVAENQYEPQPEVEENLNTSTKQKLNRNQKIQK